MCLINVLFMHNIILLYCIKHEYIILYNCELIYREYMYENLVCMR